MTVKTIIDTVSILRNALTNDQGVKYKRLAQALEAGILAGTLTAGAKLPPQRILADKLGVTIGTISRAYAELERMGLVLARVGGGTFVRQQGLERQRDSGFRNVSEAPQHYDMSRNMHIPGQETALLARSLHELAGDPQRLHALALYSPEPGQPRHRQAGARWLSHGDFVAQADQILCVNGGQHGLLCALSALFRAGDTLVTEQLSYPGLIGAARLLGIKLLGIEMDEQGLLPESLDELCRGNRVAALYCTPTLQNPTTAVLSLERRQAIARLCREHNLLILEDEAHAVLLERRPPSLSLFAPERSILIGSLSKAVAAGLRVGYLHAPQALIGRLSAALRTSCWMATPLTQELARQWIEDGTALTLLRQQIAEIERRKQLVGSLLEGLNYRSQPQSPHFWMEVPEPWRASAIEAELRHKGFLVSPAEAFAVGRNAVPQFIRASVSNASHDDQRLRDGFLAIASSLRQDDGDFGI
jgi:DNA-binding transcriptional MocR family regulator